MKYPNLLSPIAIRGVAIRNRMESAPSAPHFLQGIQNYPTESFITHFANRAKNGAAIVTITHLTMDEMGIPGVPAIDNVPGHFNMVDMYDITAQNYICQMIDAIHYYGAKAMAYLPTPEIPSGGPSAGPPPPPPGEMAEGSIPEMQGFVGEDSIEEVNRVTKEQMAAYIQEIVNEAVILKRLGFDMFSLHSSYRRCIHAKFMSPLCNRRTDEYGGTLENRCRFVLDLYRQLRSACGEDVPLEIVMSVCEADADGWSVEDTIRFAELADGLIDIIHLRGGIADPQHPTGYSSTAEKPAPYIDEIAAVSKACREKGLGVLIGASSGFHDPDLAEQVLAEGKADLICMARSWICDPEYGKKIYEGRAEDIVPCIRCNKCHVSNASDSFRSVCSVNPILGIEHKVERMNPPPGRKKRVAVVGGGPAGMKAALTAHSRGHDVVLYEQSASLGGALKHAEYASFKWPIRDLCRYFAAQLEKSGVQIKLNTKVTSDSLKAEKFDSVLIAIGADANIPEIPGVQDITVLTPLDVFGHESDVSGPVVVIGGGETGVDTAIQLAESGLETTILTRQKKLAPDAPEAHYRSMLVSYYSSIPTFHYLTEVRNTSIENGNVYFEDMTGTSHKLPFSTLVVAGGQRARHEDALSLFGVCAETYMIGDCDKVGNIQTAIRSAYSIASQL